MNASNPLVITALVAMSCARRAPPSIEPDRASAAPLRAPLGVVREAIGPDASAPTSTANSNTCSQTEPDTEERVALGLAPRAIRAGSTVSYRFDRAEVFLRTIQRPMAPGLSSAGLSLELRGPSTIRRDQAIPLQLAFRNTGASATAVIRSNDGSFEHMREPFVDLYVEDVTTQQVYRSAFVGGRCGMVNGLSAQDFVSITAGAASDAPAREWAGHLQRSKIPAPGRYRLWVVYRLCDLDQAQGMGQRIAQRPANLFVGRASSNAIELTVQ